MLCCASAPFGIPKFPLNEKGSSSLFSLFLSFWMSPFVVIFLNVGVCWQIFECGCLLLYFECHCLSLYFLMWVFVSIFLIGIQCVLTMSSRAQALVQHVVKYLSWVIFVYNVFVQISLYVECITVAMCIIIVVILLVTRCAMIQIHCLLREFFCILWECKFHIKLRRLGCRRIFSKVLNFRCHNFLSRS